MDFSHLFPIKWIMEWYLIRNSYVQIMEMVITIGIIRKEDKREMITDFTDWTEQKLLVESSENCTD